MTFTVFILKFVIILHLLIRVEICKGTIEFERDGSTTPYTLYNNRTLVIKQTLHKIALIMLCELFVRKHNPHISILIALL